MEVAILPHGSSDETEFESSSGLSFVLCHQVSFPAVVVMCGMQIIGTKNPSLERDSKVLLQFYSYRSHDLYSTHDLIDVQARNVGFSPMTKRPTGSALVSPTAAALRCNTVLPTTLHLHSEYHGTINGSCSSRRVLRSRKSSSSRRLKSWLTCLD